MRIILTTLTISAASIGALAAGALWEGRDQKELPLLGIVLSVVSALLIITGIWFESSSKGFWKFTASTGVLAAATTHACLLSLAKLAPRFAWARLVTLTAVYTLAVLIVMTIYFEPTGDLGLDHRNDIDSCGCSHNNGPDLPPISPRRFRGAGGKTLRRGLVVGDR